MDINAINAIMPRRGLPGWLGYVAAPVEFFGGIALILGLATRYAAALLLMFVIIATLSSHRYWEFAEAAPRRAQDTNFYKNLAIMGGLVFAFVTAGGRFSIDRLLARKEGRFTSHLFWRRPDPPRLGRQSGPWHDARG